MRRGFFTLITANLYFGPFDKSHICQTWTGGQRRDATLAKIRSCLTEDAIFCFQEVTSEMYADIQVVMSPTHKCFYAITNAKHNFGLLTCIPQKYESVLLSDIFNYIQRPSGWAPGCLAVLVNYNMVIVNLHASTQREAREMTCYSLCEHLKSVPRFLVCGDFNSFPDAGGVELLQNMQKLSGSYEATSVIIDAADSTRRILKTFHPYPDDKVPEGIMDYHLDHILIKGLDTGDLVKGHVDTLGHCSDHMMLELKIKF